MSREIEDNAPLVGQMRYVIHYAFGTPLEAWTGEKWIELKVISMQESYFDPMARPGHMILDMRVEAIGPTAIGWPNR
jgi:hypothetical protein